jgi:hypothetical protein
MKVSGLNSILGILAATPYGQFLPEVGFIRVLIGFRKCSALPD